MLDNHEVKLIAASAHAAVGQKYGDDPYTRHLDDVVGVLREFGFNGKDITHVAYLHDILEDTEHTPESLLALGVDPVIVAAVEIITDEPGKNRKERKAATYAKFRRHMQVRYVGGRHHDPIRLAVLGKWADRIANMRASKSGNVGLRKMYRKETPAFIEALSVEGTVLEVIHLDDDIQKMKAHVLELAQMMEAHDAV